MTDREQLEKIQKKVLYEARTFDRLIKINVLEKLIASTDEKTGKLQDVIIPLYEHDIEFLKNTMQDLGYSPKYVEDWNHFYDTTCCYVKL